MAKKSKQKKPQSGRETALPTKKSPLEKRVQQEFNRIAQEYRKDRRRHIRYVDAIDYDQSRVKRRVAATAKYAEQAIKIARPVCADRPDTFSVEEEWIFINATAKLGYDAIAEREHWLCGAAIWILDRLSERKKLREAIALLPKDDGTLDEMDTFEVYDLCYSWEVLWGMVYALRERNADCTGLKPRSGKMPPADASPEERRRNSLVKRDFCDDYTAAGAQHQEVPSRIRFRQLMDLIDDGDKTRAVQKFEEKLWEWVRRYFQCRDWYAKQEKELDDRYDRLVSRFTLEMQDLMKQEAEQKEKAKVRMLLRNPLQEMTEESPRRDQFMLVKEIKKKVEDIEEEDDLLQEKIDCLLFDFHSYAMMPREQVELQVGPEVADALGGFTIDDPYEMCFALLCLFEEGSDLPWLYFPGLCVMQITGAMLPWHLGEFDAEKDARNRLYDAQRNPYVLPPDVRRYVQAQVPKKYRPPERKDWYRLAYVDEMVELDFREQVNLAQVAYQLTGCIMPRDLNRCDFAMWDLERYGITGKKVQLPMLYCLNLLAQARDQAKDWRQVGTYLSDEEALQPEEPEQTAPEEPEDNLRERLRQQRREIEGLKKRAYEAERENRELRKRQEEEALDWERGRQELNDLRELVFYQNEGSYHEETEPEEETDGIVFPCQTRQRIVVFGGHDTWLKQIRPRLPNVRFVGREGNPNASLIRNADVVWIQPNALSHRHFYAIIGETRKHKIPVRYFTSASAERCARQLVRSDLGEG